MDIFTRLIWTSTAQHTAVNYPIIAYGAFTPNMPTKIYDDDRVAPEVFSPYRLPNGAVSAVSNWFVDTFFSNLSCFIPARIFGEGHHCARVRFFSQILNAFQNNIRHYSYLFSSVKKFSNSISAFHYFILCKMRDILNYRVCCSVVTLNINACRRQRYGTPTGRSVKL